MHAAHFQMYELHSADVILDDDESADNKSLVVVHPLKNNKSALDWLYRVLQQRREEQSPNSLVSVDNVEALSLYLQ